MSGYAVQTHDLAVRYGRSEVLSKVTLDLAPGRIHGPLGRNGTGKTTLMATLASFRAPHRGSVQIDGHGPFEDKHIMAASASFARAAMSSTMKPRRPPSTSCSDRLLARSSAWPLALR